MSKRNYSSLHINISRKLANQLNHATHTYGLSKGEIVRQAISQRLGSLHNKQSNQPINNDKEVLKQLHTFYNGNLLNSIPIDEKLSHHQEHQVVKIADKITRNNIPLTMSNAFYAIRDRNSLRILIICLFILRPYIKKYLNQHVGIKQAKVVKSTSRKDKIVGNFFNKYGNKHNHLPNFVRVRINKLEKHNADISKDTLMCLLLTRDFNEPRNQMAWIFAIANYVDLININEIYCLSNICKIIIKQKKYRYLDNKLIQYYSKSSIDYIENYDLLGHLGTYIPNDYIDTMEKYWTNIAKDIIYHKL